MLVEAAKPVSLILCILSLYALFHTAFLVPASDLHQRIYDSLGLLVVAGAISLVGGIVFCEGTQEPRAARTKLTGTLPVQVFCWASGTIILLFIISWYLETYCVFYRDTRF
jgi:hypothetical protein